MTRAGLLSVVLISAVAHAQVTDPFPGVRLVRYGASAMLVVNLCAQGVNVRATKYDERRGTPQTWAQRVGAQAAINADFFDFPGWTLVNGRARGGGEDWPADKQFFESRSYWQFGLFVAGLQEDANVAPPGGPWVTEVVGGHNVLIRNGQSLAPAFDGDGVLAGGHRRTAIGMSADRRTLFLYASGNSLTGSGIVTELLALAQAAGAPPIDIATNMDGGGSSQLYVQGLGQVVTSGREVNNHLGVYADGTSFPANCNNLPPRGSLDVLTCERLAGWAQDPTSPDQPADIRLRVDGNDVLTLRADQRRQDLCTNLMSCDHGFDLATPKVLLDGKPHQVELMGVDLENRSRWRLHEAPKSLTCTVLPPAGQLRHVINPESFAAWRFDFARDVQVVPAEVISSREVAADWPAAPLLVRGQGGQVWLVDGVARRPVSAESAKAWRLDLSTARTVSAEELSAWSEGLPLGELWLVRGEGQPAVYALDGPPLVQPVASTAGHIVPPARFEGPTGSAGEQVLGGCSFSGGPPLVLLLALLACRRRPT